MRATFQAFLPQDRRAAIRQGVALPDRATGAALFTDVSGFTPLAESFARTLGPRRGAEELTALLNQVYTVLIERIEAFGGSVISFSGDAMTCWFDDGAPEASAPAALRAVACALAMRHAMAAFVALPTPGGPATLRVKTAVAAGPVRRFQIGDPRIQTLDVLAGTTLDRLGVSAQLAEPDDVVADPATLAVLAPWVVTGDWRVDPDSGAQAAAIGDLAPGVVVLAGPPPPLDDLPDEPLRRWLLPAVAARLESGSAPLLAELRPAVALMLQFSGLAYDADDAGAALDRYIRRVQRIVARHDGVLVDLTMADKGGYLYAAFGAPIANEDDAARALRAALELRELPVAPGGGQVRLGLSRGTMRAGPYGGASRCAYGVLGDDVNLACRLMSAAAPGQVLVSERLQQAAGAAFAWHALPLMRLRGKQAPVAVYQVLDETRAAGDAPAATGLVGRASEQAAIEAALDGLTTGMGGLIVIEGEPGIGKSRLIAEATAASGARGISVLSGAGQSVEQETPYRAWRDLFSAYFALAPDASPAARRDSVAAQGRAAVPEQAERLPLLNDVLALGLAETPLTRSLSGALRSRNLRELLIGLLRARAARAPLVLVLEDAHWLDSRSWDLAAALGQALAAEALPILLIVATRRLDARHPGLPHLRALLALDGARWLRLDQIDAAATGALAAARLGIAAGDLPAGLADWLHQRSGGNPLFAEELLATLRERDLIWFEADRADPRAAPRCRLADDLDRAGQLLPATLQGLLLARLDRLPPDQLLTLKVASVVGPTFAVEPLLFARSRQAAIDGPGLRTQLRVLAAHDHTALEAPEPELAYRFKHVLTHEAAYETLLYAQRRALHATVASWYEQRFGGAPDGPGLASYYPLLAHHYRRAESAERERHYCWLAGIQAAEQYANAEAIAFFSRALELTDAGDHERRYAVLFEREAAEELLALRDDQARDLAELAALAEALDDDRRRAEVARNQARFAERLGDIDTMRSHAACAVALAEAAGATEVATDAYDQAAWACMRAGAYAEARTLAETGLRLARSVGDRRAEAQLLTALGCAYGEQEAYDTARAILEQSRQLFHDLGRQRGESVALGNLGELVARQGDDAAARRYLEAALRLYRLTGDRRNEGWALGILGMSAVRCGEYAAARRYHEQARTIARHAGDRNTESLALIDLGLVAHEQGDDRLALEYAEAAWTLATVSFTRIRCLLLRGHALAGLGRAAAAGVSYREARDLAAAADLRARIAEATAGLARIALAAGEVAEAGALIAPLLDGLTPDALGGADEPLRIVLTAYEVLAAAADPRAAALLASARAWLEQRAALLPDDAARRMFLEAVPSHRAIVAAGRDDATR